MDATLKVNPYRPILEDDPIEAAGIEALKAKGYDPVCYNLSDLFRTYMTTALYFKSCDKDIADIAKKDILNPEGFRMFIEKYM